MKLTVFLRWRLFIIIASLIFILLIFQVLIPNYSHWFAQIENINIKKQQITLSENWQQELVKLDNEKNRLEAKLNKVSQGYNVLHSLSDAIELINHAAYLNYISVMDIHTDKNATINKYQQIGITIDFKGSFHNIGFFINDLEKVGNPIQLKNCLIEKVENSLNSSMYLTVTLVNNK